jgi:hypothetical protein
MIAREYLEDMAKRTLDTPEKLAEFVSNQWGWIHSKIKEESSEDMEMLERENKNLAKALEREGYTEAQISDIANGAI